MRVPSWLAGGLAAVALLVVPAHALAHAQLRSAEPAPGSRVAVAPEEVRLVLSSPVETAFLTLRVTDARGAVVSGAARRDPLNDHVIRAPLNSSGSGPLTVGWRVLSVDGHPSGGVFGVGVGARGPAAGQGGTVRSDHGPLPVLARLLGLLAPLGLLGLVGMAAAVAAPAVRGRGVRAPGEVPAEGARFREAATRALAAAAGGWWRAWWALVCAGAVGLALGPVALLRGLRAGPGDLATLLTETRVGAAWWVQVGCLALAAGAAAALRMRGDGPPQRAGWALALGAPPAIALAAVSWSGHAATGGDRTANVVIDALHNGATALWIGGLLGLTVLVSPAVAALERGDRVRLAAGVVVRFSALALAAVATLVVTGVYRALAEVSVGDLLDTGYGRALVVKLCLFAVLVLGGAYNRMVVHPHLERAALGLDPSDRGAAAALRVSVRAELAGATVLLVVVAVMISLPPPG